MTAPLIWIILPVALAIGLFLLRRWYRLTVAAGTLFSIVLAALAWRFPIGPAVKLGPWSFQLADTLVVLGRQFILTDAERPLLLSVYLMAAFWFAASYVANAGRMFVPLGIIIVALLTAAVAVEPFLFAALLIEMAVLASIPILAVPGKPAAHGILRFLTFQTLGMPFILFAGWMLEGVEATPADSILIARVALLMGFGFVLLLGVFPFHTWILMLSEQVHPFAAAFVFQTLPWMVSLFGVSFLDRYAWLRDAENLYTILRLGGVLMVLVGGGWAAFQRHLGRMLGCAILVETGISLLALSLPGRLELFFIQLLPRSVALGVWALSLSALGADPAAGRYRAVQGLARQLPLASMGLILANFSLVGFPLLAGFPVRMALWQALSEQNLFITLLGLVGNLGLFVGGLRSLAVLVMGEETAQQGSRESGGEAVFLTIGIFSLVLIGLFPQWFLPLVSNLAQSFTRLAP